MKKILIIFLIIFSVNVYADNKCDRNELARLKKLAGNVEIVYSTEIKEKKSNNKTLYKYGEYTLTASNLNKDIRVLVYQDYYNNKFKEFKESNGLGTLGPFYDGEKVTVTIEAYVKNECSGEKLRTVIVNLPHYNVFSEHMHCAEGSQFAESKCCQSILEEKFNSYESFEKCVGDYYNKELLHLMYEGSDTEGEKTINYNIIWINQHF